MKYQLARELYDAGFPQEGKGTWVGDPASLVLRRADRVYVPTLEELIAVCGDRFYSLIYDTDNDWRCFSEVESGYIDDANGPTSTEAVARLWLALQKR